jgi:hypothetical protein
MPNVKPYLTTDDLVEAVKLTMSFPLSQNSFTYNNIVTFLNQELQLNAVPTLMQEHEEYLVYRKSVPLLTNISRYAIPDRAIGMTLRDVKFADTGGNYYDITRIAPDDKAFFQQSNGSNQTIGKFYLEGNEMVLTPKLLANPTGSLVLFYFLRPNYLVRNDRACTIQHFHKNITILDNSLIQAGDTIGITLNNQTESPIQIILTATTGVPLASEFLISSNPNPALARQETANNIALAINSLNIDNPEIQNLNLSTSSNLADGLYASVLVSSTQVVDVQLNYLDISSTFYVSNTAAFGLDNDTVEIQFDHLPLNYTDPDTDITTPLYSSGCLVDFLQTNPGHRTYTYDVKLISITADGRGKFYVSQLQEYASNSVGGVMEFYPIKVGDYICLQNECIVPQIPPELHHALAERAASRVLMAIGDKEGYAISANKIQEMDQKQATLIGSRVESSVPKVFNRYSLLRLGKSRFRRRY